MRFATWNINGLEARHEELLRWLQDNEPDVMGLQEIRTENAIRLNRFRDDLQKMGYQAEFHSEARYRGVAILSKWPLDVTQKGLPGQTGLGTRLLSASMAGWSFTTVCVPYKAGIGGPKLTWLDSLSNYLRTRADGASPAVLCGDFNIAPAPIDNGVYEPKGQPDERRIGHRSEEQSCIRSLQEAGWFDLVRKANPGCRMFSYWHRTELYHQNKGLRTDLVFGDRAACERLQAAKTDRSPLDQRPKDRRKDHAPVVVDLA